jgi:hypothetical protein
MIAIACSISPRFSFAQVTAGSLSGSVVDPSGQPVARADVQASDTRDGAIRTTRTDDSGFYRLADLHPAIYTLTVSAPGFQTAARPDVHVRVDSTTQIDLRLTLAGIAQAVDVVAPLGAVAAVQSDLGMVLDRSWIDRLPLNRRDFLQLSLLSAGVQGPVENSELSTRGAIAMHVNGGREEFNNFQLDGVDNNDAYVNRYVVQPTIDSVETFKVATNAYSAEYGRNAGGQVNIVTRRGTNQLDGFGYEYGRLHALDARNYFASAGDQPLSRHQFGGGAGGPIRVDKTFFFGNIDLLRARQRLSRLAAVPTAAQRAGDLSALGGAVVDPFGGTPFAGSVVPASRISPLARQVLALFPQPNRTGAGANYLGEPTARDDETQLTLRVDHRWSPDDRLMVRYTGGRVDLVEPYTETTGVTDGFGDVVSDRTWNVTAQLARVSGRAANSLRFGANAFARDLLTENHDLDVGTLWGVGWLNVPPESRGYPVINVAGYSRVGDAFSLPIVRSSNTIQIADDLSLEAGPHLIKSGGDLRHIRLDSTVDLFSRGQLSFTGAFTGSGIGDLLLGLPTFGLQSRAANPIAMRTNAYAAYVQDDWRVAARLTLKFGVRYEYLSPPVDAVDGMSTLDLSTGQIVRVGTNGTSRSGVRPDRDNVAPRFATTWTPNNATIVRGGYGLYFDSGMLTVNTAQYFNPPQFTLQVFTPGPQGLLTLANPFPQTSGFTPPATLSILSPDLVMGDLQHWNVAVQRAIARVGDVSVAYAGSRGSRLIRPRDLNQPAPAPGDLQARRPYPAYANIFFVESAGSSRFDSLQITFNRPITRGAAVWAAYTASKSTDDASAFLGTPADTNFPQDSHNPQAERGPSSFDVRHRLAMAYVVRLPPTNRWTRDLQIEGVTVLHTGQPFTPVLRFDNSNTGNTGGGTAGSDRPNLVGDPRLPDPTVDAWINTQAFAIAPRYTFGNAGRNGLRGPAYGSFDLSLSKRIAVGSRAGVTIALQVFNLFNRTNFDLPEHFVDEPTTFGRIFSAKAPREWQVSARVAF